jgi:hypothetical protein
MNRMNQSYPILIFLVLLTVWLLGPTTPLALGQCCGSSDTEPSNAPCAKPAGDSCAAGAVQDESDQCGSVGSVQHLAGTYRFSAGNGSATIPFKLAHNHVLLPVSLNSSQPLRLILDTGMPYEGVILFDSPPVAEAGFGAAKATMIAGESGEGCGNSQATRSAGGVTLVMPGFELEDQEVTILEVGDTLGEMPHADGIIGLSLFGRFVVRIDYDRKEVTLTEPELFDSSGPGEEIPLTLTAPGIPVITAQVELEGGARATIQPTVDTGASHAMSLHVGSPKEVILPQKSIETVVGRTMWGEVRGHLGRIRSLTLGNQKLENVVTTFMGATNTVPVSCGTDGNVGTDALRRFTVTFDYHRKRMILEPNSQFDTPFEIAMAGIGFQKTADGFLHIETITPGSPASEAGLRVGDAILRVNGRSAKRLPDETLRELFRNEGKTVRIRYVRDGQETKARLTLRRLI